MDADKFLELLLYCVPAAIVAALAHFQFKQYFGGEQRRRQFELARENQKHALPLRLQAYERLALLLERIDPVKALLRISPISEDKNDYAEFVIAQIDQEFEHNLTQQIYVTDDCWGVILTTKNATIQMLRKAASEPNIANADQLRESVIKAVFEQGSPSVTALAFVKREVKDFL